MSRNYQGMTTLLLAELVALATYYQQPALFLTAPVVLLAVVLTMIAAILRIVDIRKEL